MVKEATACGYMLNVEHLKETRRFTKDDLKRLTDIFSEHMDFVLNSGLVEAVLEFLYDKDCPSEILGRYGMNVSEFWKKLYGI